MRESMLPNGILREKNSFWEGPTGAKKARISADSATLRGTSISFLPQCPERDGITQFLHRRNAVLKIPPGWAFQYIDRARLQLDRNNPAAILIGLETYARGAAQRYPQYSLELG